MDGTRVRSFNSVHTCFSNLLSEIFVFPTGTFLILTFLCEICWLGTPKRKLQSFPSATRPSPSVFGLVLARPSPNKLICLLAVSFIRCEVETKYHTKYTVLNFTILKVQNTNVRALTEHFTNIFEGNRAF